MGNKDTTKVIRTWAYECAFTNRITGKEALKVGELPEPVQLQRVGQVPVNETVLSTQIDE